MEYKKKIFDPITGAIETFFKDEFHHILAIREEITRKVFNPLKGFINKVVPNKKAMPLLLKCADIAFEELKILCVKNSIDVWLSIIRRIPTSTTFFFSDGVWMPFATIAILKWSDWDNDTTMGRLDWKNTFGIVLDLEEGVLYDSLRLAILADSVSFLVSTHRVLGKGGKLVVKVKDISVKVSKEVEIAIKKYDERRPRDYILQDEGTPVNVPSTFNSDSDFIIFLFPRKTPFPVHFSNNDFTIFLKNHFMFYKKIDDLVSILSDYEKAIQDKFGLSSKAIIQTLYALSYQITITLSPLPNIVKPLEKKWLCECDLNQTEIEGLIRFLYNLCQKGYLRFPEEYLRKKLSEYFYSPLVKSTEEAVQLVDNFFDCFVFNLERIEEIDMLRLDHLPLIFTSPGGNCYIDFTMMIDFFRMVIEKAKEWFSTQHGDHFTLKLKTLIDSNCKDVEVVTVKKKFVTSKGKKGEADLIVKKGDTLFVIECKAFTKSREYWLGSTKEIYQRNSQITEAVKQVKSTVETIKRYVREKTTKLPEFSKIKWIVCSPTQEFLRPFNKFGMLTRDIPKVCTHEELIAFLNGKVSAR